jgi:hypothetical protein
MTLHLSRWLSLVAGVAGAAAAAVLLADASWKRTTRRAVRALAGPPGALPGEGGTISPDELAALPEPVARYFRFALAPGQRVIEHARFQQTGTMRSAAGAAWSPFTAEETFATRPPGFVWDAVVAVLPFVPLRVRDGYARGEGASEAKLAAAIPLQNMGGTPEVASASLLRYLAEAAWLPTALLPRSGVSWVATADGGARATLADHGVTVTVEVAFGAGGEIARVSALRYRAVGGKPVLTRWTGRYFDYARVEGMMIPLAAEVAWSPPEGEFAVWRGRIADASYRFAEPTPVPGRTRSR